MPDTAAIVTAAHGSRDFDGLDRQRTVVDDSHDVVPHMFAARSADDV